MFENIIKFFKSLGNKEKNKESSDTAKERLHLVLMQDRANVSADFLELMKQEIIEVIKKYIDIDEKAIDVRLTNKTNDDGTVGAPALYANIPIVTIKNEARIANVPHEKNEKVEETQSKNNIEKTAENKEKNETEQENQAKQAGKAESDDTTIKNDIIGTTEMDKEIAEKDRDEQSEQTDKVIEEAKKIQSEIEDKIKLGETQEESAEENSLQANKPAEKIEKEGIEGKEEKQNVSENAEE